MKIIKKNQKIANILFEAGLLIQLIVMLVGYSAWDIPYRGYLLHLSFGLFCLKILMTEYSGSEWCAMVFLVCLGAISYFCTGEEYVISVVVMIFAAKSVPVKKLFKWILYGVLAALFIIPFLSFFGLGHPLYDIRDYGRGGLEKRWGFGFGHANNFHGTIWYVVTLVVILYQKKLKWFHYAELTALNCAVFYFTASKAGFLCTQIVIMSGWLKLYFVELNDIKIFYWLGFAGLCGIQMISFISSKVNIINSSLLQLLDRIFTGRIRLAREFVPMESWRMLSKCGDATLVDNGWVTVYANYGWILGIVFFLGHIWLLFHIYKEKRFLELIVLMSSVFYIFMESTYCMNNAYLLSNVTYLLIMYLIREENLDENIDGKQVSLS